MRGDGKSFGILGVALLAALQLPGVAGSTPPVEPVVATFSIVACDTAAGEWGVAVASRFLAVGSVVPWAKAGVGAIATQAYANTSYGPRGLQLLEQGLDASDVLRHLVNLDPRPGTRQAGVVDAQGRAATYTGEHCDLWAGGVDGTHFAVQGNLLAGEEVITAMARSFSESKQGSLSERLLEALAVGEATGGDRRGKQSAALLVVKESGGYGGFNDRYVDLRVDDDDEPVVKLTELYSEHARTFLPAVHARLGDRAARRGDTRRAESEYARAVELFQAAIAANPDGAAQRNALAWFYVEHRMNLDEAMQLANRALELDPGNWQVLDSLAEVYFARRQYARAHQRSLEALEAAPENFYLHQQAERFRQALAAWEEGEH